MNLRDIGSETIVATIIYPKALQYPKQCKLTKEQSVRNKCAQNTGHYLSKLKKNVNIYTNIKENINTSLDIEIKVTKIIDSIFDKNILFLEQKGPVTID